MAQVQVIILETVFSWIFWFPARLWWIRLLLFCCESHKGFVQHILKCNRRMEKKKKQTAKRHRQDLVDTGQLPIMHCKFNISSSAFLHQSHAISGLVWSAQSNRIWGGPDRLVSSLLFALPRAECEFHMLVNCSLYLRDIHWGHGSGAKTALFTPHNIITVKGIGAVLESHEPSSTRKSCRAQAPVTPADIKYSHSESYLL